ncbi:MAG: hypothetical protein KME56_17455 [Candidatus Thiodiazotropha sp. (ex Ctena orbiculata)]|uniref:Uncharacterized protein n=1 Tax=Candidatus Thiodiazotropha taylori TaxID=2792791 RepID=A0A944MA58_9GAMM|nr:hypothetical protein [Candidatus Thiodiazotropha taylori]MBT2990126.1 hypothetical protein [Candidatus Thiodiazotropha taylori]MBT2998403.1 hypothetical protein [Candidatus Thiodiazotropha taylori]MBT3000306.1 hypothetical protein [Candidatus Thiodiazotropha taylori]MBT3027311.1 hypothetical protein [Candidatus Thiodiazotropha taylori]
MEQRQKLGTECLVKYLNNMIFDYFEADDPLKHRDLQRIDDLLSSDHFLKALGKDAHALMVPDDFPVVTDVIYAEKMLHSQEIWDMPEPWPYQYFADITGRINPYDHVTIEERIEIEKIRKKNIDAYTKNIILFLDSKYEEYQITQFLCESVDHEKFQKDVVVEIIRSFQSDIDAFIDNMIYASYYGGIDASPEIKRIYEAFLTGGIPCGWVGPLPEDGGDPNKCMQLLHFGRSS